MPVWPHSEMTTAYFDASEAVEGDRCEVRIDESEIVVSYQEDDERNGFTHVLYQGKNIGDGHYKLTCPERNGEATLHRFPDGKILEGYWKEDGYRGFWRIYLKK